MRRHAHAAVGILLLVACSDDQLGPNPDPGPRPPASAAVVATAGPRAFVSMAPGTEEGATGVTVRVRRTGVSVTAAVVDGGFDPIGVEAVGGDSLEITVARPGSSETAYARVPARSAPVVVRTSPRHRRVDVPLNSVIEVVFSVPMDPATLSPAIRLRAGTVEVAGTVTPLTVGDDVLGARFVPEALLTAGTAYVIDVSAAAESRDGTPLEAPAQAEFTTGSVIADATIVVNVATSGTDRDPNGYWVAIDAAAPQSIAIDGTLEIPVAAGAHTVALTGIAANCTTASPTRQVTVAAGATVTVSFAVTCAPATVPGSVRVITSTGGTDLDLTGYSITFDFLSPQPIGLNDVVMIFGVAGGGHVARLSGLSANCAAAGESVRGVTVVPGETVDVVFDITCAPVGIGTAIVTTSTSGPDPDQDGYTFTVADENYRPIGTNAAVPVALPDTGRYWVQLHGVAGNCSSTNVNGGADGFEVTGGASITIAFAIECQPDVRPSGVLAFVTQSGSAWAIHTSQADGSGRREVATGQGQIGPLAWSSDGARLAFDVADGARQNLFIIDAGGSNLVQLTHTGRNRGPTWSRDGSQIAFVGERAGLTGWSVYLVDASGGQQPVPVGPSLDESANAAWSPDGGRIAVTGRSYAFTMQPDGTGVVPLPFPFGFVRPWGQPAWSPDGTLLAVPTFDWAENDIYLIRADGVIDAVRWLATGWSPTWSPDGSMLAYVSAGIQFITLDGRRSGVTIAGASSPAWRP